MYKIYWKINWNFALLIKLSITLQNKFNDHKMMSTKDLVRATVNRLNQLPQTPCNQN